jgi:hypothetical protein
VPGVRNVLGVCLLGRAWEQRGAYLVECGNRGGAGNVCRATGNPSRPQVVDGASKNRREKGEEENN